MTFSTTSVDDGLILSALDLIAHHNINATDAIICLNLQEALQNQGHRLVFLAGLRVSSALRLHRMMTATTSIIRRELEFFLPGCTPTHSLNKTGWLLEALDGQAILPGTQVTLNLEKDTFNGTDGCNQISGSYSAGGEKISVDDNIVSTLMACEQPVMEQASTYTAALIQAAAYKVIEQQLTLLDADGKNPGYFQEQSLKRPAKK